MLPTNPSSGALGSGETSSFPAGASPVSSVLADSAAAREFDGLQAEDDSGLHPAPWALLGLGLGGGMFAAKKVVDLQQERAARRARAYALHRTRRRLAALPHEPGEATDLPRWHPAASQTVEHRQVRSAAPVAARAAAKQDTEKKNAGQGAVVGLLAFALNRWAAERTAHTPGTGQLLKALVTGAPVEREESKSPAGKRAGEPQARTPGGSAGHGQDGRDPAERDSQRPAHTEGAVAAAQHAERVRKRQKHLDRSVWNLLKSTYNEWSEDKAPRLGAALAYYTVFSIAPLLVIVIAITAFFFGDSAEQGVQQRQETAATAGANPGEDGKTGMEEQSGVPGVVGRQLTMLLGPDAAKGIESMVASAGQKKDTGVVATVLGVLALVFGASGVFTQLKDALNTIWDVEPKAGTGIWGLIRDRLLSIAMVLSVAFLLLVSMTFSAVIAVLQDKMSDILPGPDFLSTIIDLIVSTGMTTLLFALMFKYVPDVICTWRDVWLGAAVSAVLFTLGKIGIGLYLGNAGIDSAYGAAGSLVVVMLWAYYSSQILFVGAEFTQCYARIYGSHFVPRPNAEFITAEAQAEQGIRPSPVG